MSGFSKEIITSILIAAYEEPVYSTKIRKDEAVREFKNAVYLNCLKS